MTYSHQEAAVNTAKEIMLGLIARNERTILMQGEESPRGTDLASHVGDCFESLFKKVIQALKEA